MAVQNSTDAVLRALADATRRAVFERIARKETTVGELVERFDVSQPAISQHLKVLRSAGLVSLRRDGRFVYYRVNPNGLRPLIGWIERYQAFWVEKLGNLKTLAEGMDK
jgi:DNA-binding transcriptional ArsR family regulator